MLRPRAPPRSGSRWARVEAWARWCCVMQAPAGLVFVRTALPAGPGLRARLALPLPRPVMPGRPCRNCRAHGDDPGRAKGTGPTSPRPPLGPVGVDLGPREGLGSLETQRRPGPGRPGAPGAPGSPGWPSPRLASFASGAVGGWLLARGQILSFSK